MTNYTGDTYEDYLEQCMRTCAFLRQEITCTGIDLIDINDTICVCNDGDVLTDSGECVEPWECQCRGFNDELVEPEAVVINNETCETW